ncbi:hypothetical protein ACC761_06420 [Rhizobium ruizarguesonis]
MPTPIHTKYTNQVLGAPRNWDVEKHGRCAGLPICRTDDPYLISYWKFSWRERIAVILGARIRVCVASTIHPPLMLEVMREGEQIR